MANRFNGAFRPLPKRPLAPTGAFNPCGPWEGVQMRDDQVEPGKGARNGDAAHASEPTPAPAGAPSAPVPEGDVPSGPASNGHAPPPGVAPEAQPSGPETAEDVLQDANGRDDPLLPVKEWMDGETFETTADIPVPARLLDQVIGQDHAVTVVRKAAEQKRHVMMIGDPGTGKSMLARAMTEFLAREELEDVLCYPNAEDQNTPRVRVVPAGKGKEIVDAQKFEARKRQEQRGFVFMLLMLLFAVGGLFLAIMQGEPGYLIGGLIGAGILYLILRNISMQRNTQMVPKLLVGHDPDDMPPFIDATAAHSGALLGDVRHDPFQAGGLETPAHDRVEAGSIHKAHRGVLYIDEINTLQLQSQQHLLTALQDKKFQITGQSERSSGAMVKTEPVPCNFILVAAGNLDAVKGMHSALRSRIRGYGYEIYVNDTMDDTHENRHKLCRFVAQEIAKEADKIPPMDRSAVAEVIHEAQRRAGQRGKLTLRLRELGGLVRVAGDLAHEEGAAVATRDHVVRAKIIARNFEKQYFDRAMEVRQRYSLIRVEGARIGAVHGLSVIDAGNGMSEGSGNVMDIEAEVTPAMSKGEGRVIAADKLGDIAKASVSNISAIIKKYLHKDVHNYDIHIQFVLAHDGVDGDSASVTMATAILSAITRVKIRQDVAMTGSLSLHGEVLPIGGVTAKIEAAASIGIKKVLIPHQNQADVMLEEEYADKIEVVPCDTLHDVLAHALVDCPEKVELLSKLEAIEQNLEGGPTPAVPLNQAQKQEG